MDRGKYLHKITSAANLRTEQLPGLPVVEIAGDCRVLIERHMGVIGYDCNSICVKVSYGRICVNGCDLQLVQMTKYALVIYGKIGSISIMSERC